MSFLEKALCFLVIFLLLFQTESQVISNARAQDGTLKCLVQLKVLKSFLNGAERKETPARGAGAIIKLNWILTAAHMVKSKNKKVDGIQRSHTVEKVAVKAGTKDWFGSSNKTQIRVIEKKR